ncbi:MAG: CPBP family intramembrane metalloprotease [Oribacterium sp.]|nr:CPBP family intramembrane metalloprotease [Oribacterium sp.]
MKDKLIIKKNVLADRFSLILAPLIMLVMVYLPNTGAAVIASKLFDETSDIALQVYLILAPVIAFIVLLIFERWFYPEYKSCITLKGVGYGLLLCIPVAVFWCVWWGIQVGAGFKEVVPLAAEDTLKGVRPGITEEISFRAIAVVLLLRRYREKKTILIPVLVTSVFVGLIHMTNLTGAEDIHEVVGTLVQSCFAIVFGLIIAVVFILFGSLWPSVILHSAYDTLCFCIIDVKTSPDWPVFVSVAGVAVIAAAMLVYLMKKQERAEMLLNIRWKNDGIKID